MRPIDADALFEVIKKSMAENPHKEKMQRAMHIHEHKYFLTLLTTFPTIQPVATDTNVGDKISKFIDGLEEIFAGIRERHVDDSVCGLCEYDGAYVGESGDWCNECPGFDKDDCFKLSDKIRKEWTEEIIKALPSAQPHLITQIQNGIKATNTDDVYSCGMRNGMRWCISLIDDKEPLYEKLPSVQPETERTMEEFMYGQDMGNLEDGSL